MLSPSIEFKKQLLKKILTSNTFSNAPTSSSLLQYLFDATNKGVDLKEGIIDIEFFGVKQGEDSSNPRVRVNVYNLRKKLLAYNESEGKDDAFKLVIEKGQYCVSFEKNASEKLSLKGLGIKDVVLYSVIALLLASLVISHVPQSPPEIWKSFLSIDEPTTVYISDLFGIMGNTPTGRYGWMRDYKINSIEDLYQFMADHPDKKGNLKPANYLYTTYMAAYSVQKLQSLFQTYERSFDIRFLSQSSISEIKESNAIYIGHIKNDNPFVHFFNEENPFFSIENEKLLFADHPTLTDTLYNLHTTGLESEYAIVSKLSGPDYTDHLLFFSDHDIGVISTIEYFTKGETLKEFLTTISSGSKYFTAIFKAKGQGRTNTDLELIMVVEH